MSKIAGPNLHATLSMLRRIGASVAGSIWPPGCMACGADVSDPFGLCPSCWADLRLVSMAGCDRCAKPMPVGAGQGLQCEDCARLRMRWQRGRAATLYGGSARRLVLSLKHGDRAEIARPMARWMRQAGRDVLTGADMVVPVPLHWTRRLKRRLNQSAELSRRIADAEGLAHGTGILLRTRATDSQRGRSFEQRQRNVAGAFALAEGADITGKRIVLVDDVMTTGATLNAGAAILRDGGAASVDILVFARVTRENDVRF